MEEGARSQVLFDSEVPREEEEEVTAGHNMLWVDKYSPKHYTELLSDDVSHFSSRGTGWSRGRGMMGAKGWRGTVLAAAKGPLIFSMVGDHFSSQGG